MCATHLDRLDWIRLVHLKRTIPSPRLRDGAQKSDILCDGKASHGTSIRAVKSRISVSYVPCLLSSRFHLLDDFNAKPPVGNRYTIRKNVSLCSYVGHKRQAKRPCCTKQTILPGCSSLRRACCCRQTMPGCDDCIRMSAEPQHLLGYGR
jgi:hypothetical protein